MQRVLKFAASIRDICQVRDVVRKKTGLCGKNSQTGGMGLTQTHYIFFCFFSSGAYNMAKKYFENNGKKGENSLIGRVGGGGPPHGNFSHIIPFFSDNVPYS